MQQRPYPMEETPIAKVPNPKDNIIVKLMKAIMPSLKKMHQNNVQFKIPPNDKQKELNQNNNN
jgi:hypothetical protein